MSVVRLTPAINPDEIEKTLAFNEAHTSERLNHQIDAVMGGSRVLSGFRVEPNEGGVRLFAGQFVVDGVVVTLKLPIDLDLTDVMDGDDTLDGLGVRLKSAILWAFCPDSSNFSAVIFGVTSDEFINTVTGDGYVHIAVLQPNDESVNEADRGRWSRVFGFSNSELARDLREGVQTIEAIPFASETGALRPNPDFSTRPYFTSDAHLLVFADRFLISSAIYGLADPLPHFFRKGITGFREQSVDPTDFDFGSIMDVSYNLTTAAWGVLVCRDIEWQVAFHTEIGPAYLTLPFAVDPDDPKLLVFLNGVYQTMNQVTVDITGLQLVVSGDIADDSVYHVVKLADFVFEETVSLEPTGVAPINVDVEIPSHLFDAARHTLMVFLTVESGSDVSDGGYIQINRRGTATRDSQGVVVSSGFSIIDAGTIRLHDVFIDAGVSVSATVLCLRGSTHQNFLSQDRATAVPFYKKWKAVTGEDTPTEFEIHAFPDLEAFIAAAPGADQVVQVVVHRVGNDFIAPDGTLIGVDSFKGYMLEQAPTFDGETSPNKSPREITGNEGPDFNTLSGFFGSWTQVSLTIPTGAQAAAAGDPVKLRGGHLIENLPPYEIGASKLRVAIDGIRLIPGVDYEEKTNTSVVIRTELKVGSYLEAWVE